MNKLYLTLSLSVIFNFTSFLKAQSEIWGLNASGGDGFGVLYGMPAGATATTTQYNFAGSPGFNPQSLKLIQASNGKLYGMTNSGGPSNVGVIFEYDTLSGTYTRKVEFTGANGANPKGSLFEAANGKLYGMTQLGGANNQGVIFEYIPSTNVYNVLINLTGISGAAPGSQPSGSLMQPDLSSSKLYGVTRVGGAGNFGVLFEFDYNTNAYVNKVDFTGTAGTALGSVPNGQLVKAVSASSSTTTLYGLASTGGTNTNGGTLFEYDYALNVMTKKYDFTASGINGSSPQGSLLLASNGRLYGTALLGGTNNGVIFEYIISSNTYNKLTDLVNGAGSIGGSPSDLMQASNGKIYGLTRSGGANNNGAIFEYDVTNPAVPVYTKKVDLLATTGSVPLGGLMQVSTGKLYGVTSVGGAVNGGVLFQYSMGATTHTKKIDFNLSAGGNPNGALIQASNGKLYGLAAVGGTNNAAPGVLFEYDRTSGIYTKKVDLSGNTGANPGSTPFGSLMQASNLKLYGLTSAGGSFGVGTLFSYDISTSLYTKIIDLSAALGSVPYGALAQFTGTGTANGKIYGMTKQGGASSQGVIFEFDPGTNGYTKKYDFSLASVNGYSAFGAMVESNNKFYGMTQSGGANSLGVIFEYDPNTNSYLKRIDFTGTTGAAIGSLPFGSLVSTATVGVLYGMTRSGGANDLGVIFEYNTLTNTYTKKYDMIAATGSQPLGSLIRAANGKLYGVTNGGGANSSGVLFEYDIDNVIYTKKMDFSTASGNFPTYTRLLEVCTKPLTPGSITSSTNAICAADGTSKNYSITAVANATAYAWTLPAGASITSGSTVANITANMGGIAPGSYTFGVTGVNICGTGTMSTSNLTINALPTVSVNSGPVCAGSVFTIIPSGANTYSVQGNSFTVQPSGNSSYTVYGISSAGCISANTATSDVTVNILPTIVVNSGTICAGNSFTIAPTGVITFTPSGGSAVVSPATSTFYTVIGTDGNNCVSANTATSNVTVNALPSIGIGSSSSTMCVGGSVTLTPSGAGPGATYFMGVFSGAGPFVVSPGSSTSFTAAATTSFGCVSSNTPAVSITVYTLPVISVNNPTMCFGQSATIIPNGAGTLGTYTSGIINTTGSFTVNPASSSNFTIAGTSSLGCVSAGTATSAVTVYTLPVIGVNSGSICAGSVYTFFPTGAVNYTMTGPVSGVSFPVSPPASISYTIAGTSSNGCVSAGPATANLTVFALPTLSVNSGSVCAGIPFTINPVGGTSYTIQPNGIVTTTNVAVTPLSNTTYTLMGINAAGCSASFMPVSSVTVVPLPVVTVTDGAVCQGNVFTASVSGAFSYTYVSSTATMFPTGPLTLTPSISMTLNVFGTSLAGCVSTVPVLMTITAHPLPPVAINGTTDICAGGNVTLTASGASSYDWGGIFTPVIVDNPPASVVYTVVGTDGNNCSNTATFSVTVNPLPTISVPSGAVCTGNCYTLTPSGADTYTYLVSGSSIVCPSVTTDYSVTGTSTAGCVSPLAGVATVSVVNILTVTISGNTAVCIGGTLNLTANGASTYSWSTGLLSNTIVVSPLTNTNISVMGISGTCSDVATTSIIVNPLPVISSQVDRPEMCLGESMNLTAFGGVSYLWSNASTNTIITVSPSSSSVYSVEGTDANGCKSSSNVVVNVSLCTGIAEFSGTTWQYELYPNPNAGELVIETTAEVSATIVNALGQTILKQQLNAGKNQIDLNQHAKGIYFVQLKNGNSTKTIKIVKQ